MIPLLEVRNLKKYFKTPKGMLHAVDDVSFTIGEGKTLGVVGESGCGKSTLGRVVIKLLDATAGEVIFESREITSVKHSAVLHRSMQMIFGIHLLRLTPGCQ